MRLVPIDFHKEKVFGVEDDFTYEGATATTNPFLLPSGLVLTAPGGPLGTIATGDAFGGQLVATTDAGDDTLELAVTENEIYQYVNDKPIRGIAKGVELVLLPEQSNFLFGFQGDAANGMETTPMQADGAGIKATGDCIGFYKPGLAAAAQAYNQDYWHCVSMADAAVQYTELSAANCNNLSGVDWKGHVGAATAGEFDMMVEWVPTHRISATVFGAEVRFWMAKTGDALQLVAKHVMVGAYAITDAAADLMNFGVALQNLTDICSVNVDYVKGEQLR